MTSAVFTDADAVSDQRARQQPKSCTIAQNARFRQQQTKTSNRSSFCCTTIEDVGLSFMFLSQHPCTQNLSNDAMIVNLLTVLCTIKLYCTTTRPTSLVTMCQSYGPRSALSHCSACTVDVVADTGPRYCCTFLPTGISQISVRLRFIILKLLFATTPIVRPVSGIHTKRIWNSIVNSVLPIGLCK